MDPRWEHPFTCMVSGPTGSGKTVFVNKFLTNLSHVMTPVPEEVVWCYGAWQPAFKSISNVQFVEGLPDFNKWTTKKRKLVIIDDLMAEADQRVSNLFTKGSHHQNMSVIFLVQNVFSRNKEQRTISLNSHYLVLFKNPRDASQIVHLAKQMYPGKTTYVQEAFKDATSEPYGYLLIDLRQNTPEHLRLRSKIFPSEHQAVYLQK